ncbi:hypothetical protein [Roseimaritima multifibrata]|nr:hypothetical protein [Roseimaritima multifibrata]
MRDRPDYSLALFEVALSGVGYFASAGLVPVRGKPETELSIPGAKKVVE